MTEDGLTLFGTLEPRPEHVLHTAGRTTFEWIDGGIHAIRRDGVEVVRAVTFPVRDPDWGTLAPVLSEVLREDRPEGAAGERPRSPRTRRVAQGPLKRGDDSCRRSDRGESS